MCGIFGIWQRNGLDLPAVHRATTTLQHRGPDDEGYLLVNLAASQAVLCGSQDTDSRLALPSINQFDGNSYDLAFGFRRLAILDLSPSGHQPMASPDRRFWIVFNGEIYNYLELRRELTKMGYEFRTGTDTEVILAAYRQWGPDCLERFNGMWAFLLLDLEQHALFAARDRFGVKPLYYWYQPGKMLAFASEIKAFTALPGFKASLNYQRAYDYLVFSLTDHTRETMFAGVNQLRGGERLLISLDRPPAQQDLPVETWWSLPDAPIADISPSEAANHLRDLLTDAVRLRLRADVPIGSCLSGGLDSSSIVCVVNQLLRAQNAAQLQRTFSACSDVPQYDERRYIAEVIRATHTDAYYTLPSAEGLWQGLDALVWHQDEPFDSTSNYAQWEVFRCAADQGVKVMLDGQGADEQLAGYVSGYHGVRLASLLLARKWVPLLQEMGAYQRVHGYPWFLSILRLSNAILPNGVRSPLRALLGKPLVPSWLRHKYWEDRSSVLAEPSTLTNSHLDGSPLKRLSRNQLLSSNLPRLLRWEDRDSMAHSIESRVPFLDYRLVNFVYNLPDDLKVHDAVSKHVLRQAVTGLVPRAIVDRVDKMGFVTPESVWLRTTLRDGICQTLRNDLTALNEALDVDRVFQMTDQALNGRRNIDPVVWRIFCFGRWVSRYGVVVQP